VGGGGNEGYRGWGYPNPGASILRREVVSPRLSIGLKLSFLFFSRKSFWKFTIFLRKCDFFRVRKLGHNTKK
jgi:hypothetical protein